MQSRKHLLALLVSLAFAAFALAPSAASAWAPADSATVHPGVQTVTQGAQCTSNFIFQNGSNVYIGQAAHCSGTGGATETDGCDSGSLPNGTAVEIEGASQPGTMVYNSWLAMQANGETDADTCAYNDFALVRVNPADVDSVNPSVPGFGGPTGVGSWGGTGSTVYTYGNSSLRGGASALSPKQGVVVQNHPSGWSHDVYTATPGIPGDSGSGFLNASGGAIGVLSTVQLAPLAGSNGVGDLGKELAYARANGNSGLQLVAGTEPFNGNTVSAVLSGLGLG
ncbi:MAG: serine protease, partial [Solirubrobacterales bacterium]